MNNNIYENLGADEIPYLPIEYTLVILFYKTFVSHYYYTDNVSKEKYKPMHCAVVELLDKMIMAKCF